MYGNRHFEITVDRPDATFTFTQIPSTGCTPLDVTFNVRNMSGIVGYEWDFRDGSPLNFEANPTHTFINTSSVIQYHTVKLTVRSASGCEDTFMSTVTVNPAVNAAFAMSTDTICSGGAVVFTSTPGASQYLWDFGDGISGYSPAEVVSHIYTNFDQTPKTLTVRLTTSSFYGCSDEITKTLVVMPMPKAQFVADPPLQAYSPSGNAVTFTDQTNPGNWTYLWRFGDGATSTVQNPTHVYTDVGDYNVTLIVSNASCSDSITRIIRVTPVAPIADFDPIPSGCSPWLITLNNTSLNTEVTGTTYWWDFGDGSVSTSKNPNYTYFTPGTYRVELTVTGPGGTSTKSQIVHAYESPKAYFDLAPHVVYANDERVRMYNLSTGASSFLWEFGDGDTSKLREPTHRYMDSGVYDVTLWAYSDNGCSDKYTLSPGVTVESSGELRFANVFRPNLTGPIERTGLPTGGPEVDQFFYPPIRERVLEYRLQIFNRLGVLIFESRDINIPWNGYYNGQLCSQGVYVWFVEGKYANGQPFKQVGDVTLLH